MPYLQTTRKSPIKALDGLRGLACLLVLLGHAGYSHYVPLVIGIASTGVVLFFALSGFLMAYHYHPKKFSIVYWASFLGHRLIRIYPPFFIATFGYLWIHNPDPFQSMIPGWILHHAEDHLWTVPVEIKFYLAYPLIIFCSLLLSPLLLFLILLLVGVFLYAAVPIDTTSVMFFRYYFIFNLGVYAGIIYNKSDLRQIKPVYWDLMALASFIILYFCVLKIPLLYPSNQPQPFFWKYAWIHGPAAALGVFSLTQSRLIGGWLLGNPIARFMGRISFSLYLVHWFIIRAFHQHHFKNSLIVFIVILSAAFFYYFMVERPFIRLAKAFVLWFSKKSENSPIEDK